MVTLDEVQRVPELMRAIKVAVDRDRRPGRFLLTESANLLLLPQLSDSLAGRMEVVHLQPLTEAEKGRAGGKFIETFLAGGIEPENRPADGTATGDLLTRLHGWEWTGLQRTEHGWQLELSDGHQRQQLNTRALVDATGARLTHPAWLQPRPPHLYRPAYIGAFTGVGSARDDK